MELIGVAKPEPRPIAMIALGEEQRIPALALARRLRARALTVLFAFGGNLGKQMKWANRINARRAVIVGSDEIARAVVAVRDMDTGAQEEVALAQLDDHLSIPA